MTLGMRLKRLREERGLYMTDLEPITGVKKSTISGYEHDKKKPKMDTLKKLASFYGVTTDYLLGREDKGEISAQITKIAEDLNNLPEGENKDKILSIIRNMIKMIDNN